MTEPRGAMWGGRFEGETDPLFRALNDSLPFDHVLLPQDLRASAAWARALGGAGVLNADEVDGLCGAIAELERATEADPSVVLESDAEDVHSWVELALVERVGALGKKLHTGRSRNDQVATDLRLWVREAIDERSGEILTLQHALVELAERSLDVVMPGYTHLQRAQPVPVAHWCLAYVEMLDRDRDRLADARARLNRCPLGSGALAGTTYPVDRNAIARELGFDAPTSNSLDAVSDRDFVLETLAAAATCGLHLSRLGEEIVVFASSEFGFVSLSDSVTSGSSLMPQKKNPDAAELLRGKSGRLVASWVGLATTLKGLSLAYNKDLQEDKEPAFDAMRQLSLCLRAGERVVAGARFDPARCTEAARGGHANATELADYLVGKGVAFREAHDIAGRAVRVALERGVALEALSDDELRSVDERIGPDVRAMLELDAVLAKRNVQGGAGPDSVRASLQKMRAHLQMA
ncbi:MAG: argininosuccinate lyase [Planctomycetota bacterium]